MVTHHAASPSNHIPGCLLLVVRWCCSWISDQSTSDWAGGLASHPARWLVVARLAVTPPTKSLYSWPRIARSAVGPWNPGISPRLSTLLIPFCIPETGSSRPHPPPLPIGPCPSLPAYPCPPLPLHPARRFCILRPPPPAPPLSVQKCVYLNPCASPSCPYLGLVTGGLDRSPGCGRTYEYARLRLNQKY